MISGPVPVDESERLAELQALEILDTPPEDRFDVIVELAARVFRMPIAYVAMIDANRQWLKSRCGVQVSETSRDISFCAHTILQDRPLVVPDALLDDRFRDNPLVMGDPFVRFYAGHPLKGPGGRNVGTLCLADRVPRTMSEGELEMLARPGRHGRARPGDGEPHPHAAGAAGDEDPADRGAAAIGRRTRRGGGVRPIPPACAAATPGADRLAVRQLVKTGGRLFRIPLAGRPSTRHLPARRDGARRGGGPALHLRRIRAFAAGLWRA